MKKQLEEKLQKHKQIKSQLEFTQSEIIGNQGRFKEMEWEYEVKLQQYQYLD